MLRKCALLLFAACYAESALAGDEVITRDYQFGSEPLGEYARELHPVVPVRVARILLPEGQTLRSVSLDDFTVQKTAFEPRIASQQVPLTANAALLRRPDAYEGGPYPSDWLGTAKVSKLRGYSIVEVPIYPLRVTGPGEGSYIERATLRVETTTDKSYWANSAAQRRHNVRDLVDAERNVDNAPQAKARIVPEDEEASYLIIGPRDLIGTEGDTPLQPIIDDKHARNLHVILAPLEDVSPPKDPAEIRAFIKKKHAESGVDYVLLVGDKGKLPWKYVRSGMRDDGDPVPTDQYYACLDGEFSSPSSIDWACEVAVGRVGAKTRTDVAHWAAKSAALSKAVRDKRAVRFLNFGEKLDSRTLGDRFLDYLAAGSTRAPRTMGFPRAVQVTKLYETFRKEISGAEFMRTLNEGDYHVVNHLGHANETYVFRTTAAQAQDGLRSRPAFYYSQGCYPNDPDTDNWTIQMVRMKDYGPAAMIANTRYGWYAPGNYDEGSSSILHRSFWSMRFASGVKSVGFMNHKAKEAMIANDSSAVMIYTALESTLIGDPELDLGL